MKKFMISALTSISALTLGFSLMAFPFHIFESLSGMQMRIIFIIEMIVYFGIFAAVALKCEAKKDRRARNKEIEKKHKERIEKRKKEMSGIKIPNFDTAA